MREYKILLVVRWPVGGIRTFLRYVYRNFDCAKYRFTLICPELPEVSVLMEDLCGLDLTLVPTARFPSNKQFFREVTRVIWEGDFDLIHSHGFTSAICSVLGAILRKTPHVLTCHDVFTEGQFIGFRGWVKKLGLSAILATLDGIHCVSYDARVNLLTYLRILKFFEKKVTAIPHGIEVEGFLGSGARNLRNELGLGEETFLIGFLGRFMSQKGFSYLIAALENLLKRRDLRKRPVVLAFGSEDGFFREERQTIKIKGLEKEVLFLPFAPNVASTLKGLDVVVMPSLWEACGLLAMEAMVAGVPLIGTNCVGLREVLRNTPSKVVPVKDSHALSEALCEEMNTPSVERAQDFVSEAAIRFDVKVRAAELEKLVLMHLEGV